MSVIFIDSERNYVHDVFGDFVICQTATSGISWQDCNNTRPVQCASVRYMHRLRRFFFCGI